MNYKNFFLMTTLSFVSMYILMYIMVDSFANVYPNLNQLYMAGVMTMPMMILELLFMRAMYPNKKLNNLIMAFSLITFTLLIMFVRKQTWIDDKEFLKSMIPHHASAILMCNEASLKDPEIKELCKKITSGQQAEIDFMKAKLEMLKKR